MPDLILSSHVSRRSNGVVLLFGQGGFTQIRQQLIQSFKRHRLGSGNLNADRPPCGVIVDYEKPPGDATVFALLSPVGWDKCK
jgi:hypothetical protein